jgi:type I restriction enzyme, R subunit
VQHFIGRGQRGKAMVVSIDKATAVQMYDKVHAHWQIQLAALAADLETCDPMARPDLEARLRYLQETDMAVVVSQSQNEVADLLKKGADIRPHRQRLLKEDLEEKFKNPDDPFRLVFVCAMWMTGFDAPACSTLYLDKPMRDHTLMQTIARANRVFGDKVNGLIVDYIGVFRNLQKALAIYGSAADERKDRQTRSGSPPRPKSKLLTARLKCAIASVARPSSN